MANPVANTQRFRNFLKRYMGKNRLYPVYEYNSIDVVKLEDDFLGDTLSTDLYTVSNGTGASAADPVITAGTVNGIVDFVTGTAGNDTASSELSLGLNFRGDRSCAMVARIALSVITGVKVEVGFTDALADAGAVATKATPTLTATDCALWCLDTTDNVYWEGIAANNGSTSPAATVEAAISPVANTYEYLMVELREYETDTGWCAVRYRRFDADGGLTYTSDWQGGGKTTAANAGPNSTVLLTPWVYVEARNTTTKTLSLDYWSVWQRRTASDG